MTVADIRDYLPHRMRFTKGIDNPKCFELDHDWKETGRFQLFGRNDEQIEVKCDRCQKEGFLMDNQYWQKADTVK